MTEWVEDEEVSYLYTKRSSYDYIQSPGPQEGKKNFTFFPLRKEILLIVAFSINIFKVKNFYTKIYLIASKPFFIEGLVDFFDGPQLIWI